MPSIRCIQPSVSVPLSAQKISPELTNPTTPSTHGSRVARIRRFHRRFRRKPQSRSGISRRSLTTRTLWICWRRSLRISMRSGSACPYQQPRLAAKSGSFRKGFNKTGRRPPTGARELPPGLKTVRGAPELPLGLEEPEISSDGHAIFFSWNRDLHVARRKRREDEGQPVPFASLGDEKTPPVSAGLGGRLSCRARGATRLEVTG